MYTSLGTIEVIFLKYVQYIQLYQSLIKINLLLILIFKVADWLVFICNFYQKVKKAGAELCQAQAPLCQPVEDELASNEYILICSTFIRVNKACFADFHLFKSSSREVVFHGGPLPDFESLGLYWTSPTNVTNHVLLISSYLGHLPVRSTISYFSYLLDQT